MHNNTENFDFLGKGIYSISDVARIIRATNVDKVGSASVRRWTTGYEFKRNGSTKFSKPLLLTPTHNIDGDYRLTFLQLIESRMIAVFRQNGVAMSTIRAAAEILSEAYGVDHPFALRRLWTDGKRFYTDVLPKRLKDMNLSEHQMIHEIEHGQYVLDIARDFFLRNVEYDCDIAGRLWPLGPSYRVVIDPQRSFGRPIDTDSGVTTYVLYSMRKNGTSLQNVANWYNVKIDAVKAAEEFETRMAA